MFFLSKFYKPSAISYKLVRGFTLIEMLVVLAIATFLTAAVLANLPRFQDQTQLELAAQEVAIDIRGAQTFTIGTKAAKPNCPSFIDPTHCYTGSGQELQSNGVHFDLTSGANTVFQLFVDLPHNDFPGNIDNVFDSGKNSSDIREAVESYSLPPGYRFWTILNPANGYVYYWLDVLYKRPYTEATLTARLSEGLSSRTPDGGLSPCFRAGGGGACPAESLTSADIYIKGPSRDPRCKVIQVYNNGQIAVKPGFIDATNPNCS